MRVDSDVRVVRLDRADQARLLTVDAWAWGQDPQDRTTQDTGVVVDGLDWDRTYGACRGTSADLSGCYSVVSADVPLPGGTAVRGSGLTWVGVHPRDRRRGVLSAMIAHHLDDVAARGEPVSLLFAAEAAIYGRFGYGAASQGVRLTLPRGAGLRDVQGVDDLVVDLDHADADRYAEVVAAAYEHARHGRPGWLSRDRPGVRRAVFLDPYRERRGAEPLKLLTVAAGGDVRGYALFRRRPRWEQARPAGEVAVREVVAPDAATCRALWARLTDLDLTASVHTPALAVDDPLLHLLVDARAAAPLLVDGLWVRLVDVPAALAARGYATGVEAVLAVTDALRPANAGHWHLRAGPDGTACTATERPAHLELDVRELGAAYLGGVSLAALAGAGLVRVHDERVLAAAATAFASSLAPHCPWQF